MKTKRVIIFTDGAARNNPGPAAIGAIIRDTEGNSINSISRPIGNTTNNQAEYRAVIAALEYALRSGISQVSMYSDSELIVNQINGQYRVKEATLKPLYQRVKHLQLQLESFKITHVPREQNEEANRLANMALG